MKNINIESARSESGFTLVELAVVMIIIGLLVGGILKGQEMIANAQVTSTIAQAKAIDAATGTFRDIYDSFPGDMAGAGTRLVGCTGACAPTSTTGDSILSTAPFGTMANDSAAFFPQLEAADLLSGVNGSVLPSEISGSNWSVGYSNGAAVGLLATPRGGHYITLDSATITPLEAARMDRKVDDGAANTGSAGGQGTASATGCANAGVYNEGVQGDTCGFAVRIQG